jgi:hypothetical protein
MSVRLGIYEIFSRIVPGGFYLTAIVQFLIIAGLVQVDWQTINNVSLIASFGLIVVCYILGEALDRVALAWFRIFKRPGFSVRSYTEFRKRHLDRWEIDFREDEWSILLAFIRTKNLELASEIERHNALSIMLRNVSVGLLLMAINSLIQFFVSRNIIYIVIAVILLVISVLIIYESIKFRGWFYNGIFETTLAYRLNLEDSIKPVRNSPKRSKDKQQDEQ